jgi:hypothetical protein
MAGAEMTVKAPLTEIAEQFYPGCSSTFLHCLHSCHLPKGDISALLPKGLQKSQPHGVGSSRGQLPLPEVQSLLPTPERPQGDSSHMASWTFEHLGSARAWSGGSAAGKCHPSWGAELAFLLQLCPMSPVHRHFGFDT